jgi:catechol 2,3-dioxygenase
MSIEADTTIGQVRLTVSDQERSRAFYEQVLGLQGTERDNGSLAFGAPGGVPLVELRPDPSAPALNRRATGLYHLAILMPSRVDLAQALQRIAETSWPLEGASDHLVSEALYLSDPDGNGIEVYRDRPREQWPQSAGQLQMATLPLDLPDLTGELKGSGPASPSAPHGARIGHVHLQVSDLGDAERFYTGVLGFDVTVRGYPGALFVSAGGYHHHVGLNTWHSAGAKPPAAGSIGLRSFEVELPNRDALSRLLERVHGAGIEFEHTDGTALVRDPSGNGILLRAR